MHILIEQARKQEENWQLCSGVHMPSPLLHHGAEPSLHLQHIKLQTCVGMPKENSHGFMDLVILRAIQAWCVHCFCYFCTRLSLAIQKKKSIMIQICPSGTTQFEDLTGWQRVTQACDAEGLFNGQTTRKNVCAFLFTYFCTHQHSVFSPRSHCPIMFIDSISVWTSSLLLGELSTNVRRARSANYIHEPGGMLFWVLLLPRQC